MLKILLVVAALAPAFSVAQDTIQQRAANAERYRPRTAEEKKLAMWTNKFFAHLQSQSSNMVSSIRQFGAKHGNFVGGEGCRVARGECYNGGERCMVGFSERAVGLDQIDPAAGLWVKQCQLDTADDLKCYFLPDKGRIIAQCYVPSGPVKQSVIGRYNEYR